MVTKLYSLHPLYFSARSLGRDFVCVGNGPPLLTFSSGITPSCFCLPQSTSSANARHLDPTPVTYGPSIREGNKPAQNSFGSVKPAQNRQAGENDSVLDEESFTRVYDISALRVPSKDCFTLESRLRGHLLNWPRIRNIARVPGDEVDPDVAPFLGDSTEADEDEEDKRLVSLRRRIYGKDEEDGEQLSPVLYRDKLVKTFNSRGFEKFRNLAKISKPKKRKKKEVGEDNGARNKGVGKNDFAVVEVVEEDEEEEGLKSLIGNEFGKNKWRGSTRLLLLDKGCAGKGIEELPQAVKVAVRILN